MLAEKLGLFVELLVQIKCFFSATDTANICANTRPYATFDAKYGTKDRQITLLPAYHWRLHRKWRRAN